MMTTNKRTSGIHAEFLQSSERFPQNPALEVEGHMLSYSELKNKAFALAATLEEVTESGPPLTAVFAYRSAVAFAGILASLFQGQGYVPLNRTFPPERTRMMIERAGCRSMVVDKVSALQLPKVLEGYKDRLLILAPELEDVSELQSLLPGHIVFGRNQIRSGNEFKPKEVEPDSVAYILFTSGSTGIPKGVMISHRNVLHYVKTMKPRYGLTPQDRCSQFFDMTFDPSVHDMFLTWAAGACLCCPSQKETLKPGRFIRDARLTVWYSVPSTAVFMRRFGELQQGLYPNLRWGIFSGEALPAETVKAWAQAAPNAFLENIYGPTELTINCTAYRWDNDHSSSECELGVVPIGEPLSGMNILIVNEQLQEVAPEKSGELLMAGPLVGLGYWRDPERTAKSFIVPPGKTKVYYRTGDRVRQLTGGKTLVYLGRIDNQVKVLGHRVELGEIEAVLREETALDAVIAVGWPVSPSGADGIEAFLQTDQYDTTNLVDRLKRRLPPYMVPRRIHLVSAFPLNANGKFDRRALISLLTK